jgi:ribosome-associated toxin RatA of RatAB toxin-antitoxin module
MGTKWAPWARQSQIFEQAPKQAPLRSSLHVNLHNVHEDFAEWVFSTISSINVKPFLQ